MAQRRREVKVGTLLLGNDKTVITDKVLSYFYCLSSKFEIYITHYGTKLKYTSHVLGLN